MKNRAEKILELYALELKDVVNGQKLIDDESTLFCGMAGIIKELYAENLALKSKEEEAKRLAHNYLELDICQRIYDVLKENGK